MKIFGLRKILTSLIFGSISSIMLLYIELKNFFEYADKTDFAFTPVFLFQTLLFSIVFLYVSLLFELKRENLKGENRFKTLEKLRLVLQILLALFMASIFYLPILGNFFFMFSILLLCFGAALYFQTKSKLAVSIILWALAILVLTYLMTILVYGIENCILSTK